MDYSYQNEAARTVLENALNENYLASVLAACPGSGKTTISHMVINNYLSMFPTHRVLVLTEGQSVLTNQYLEELDDANVEIKFTYGKLGSGKQVEVGIPQGMSSVEGSYDLLIVDEAHNYYLEPMVQGIVSSINPKHVILMTGSPTKYNKHNEDVALDYMNDRKSYAIYYIAAEDLMDRGVFSHVTMEVYKVPNRNEAKSVVYNAWTKASNPLSGYNLEKVMIACPNIQFAKTVASYLTEKGRKVSLSTSKNDPNGEEIKLFKKGEKDVLIVVGRGILGFNDKNITCLMDFRSSDNLDSSYQLFARVLRVHPKNIGKSYLRIGDKDFNKQEIMLHKIGALMDREVFINFTGKNIAMSSFY